MTSAQDKPITITAEMFTEAIHAVVEEFGRDHVYNRPKAGGYAAMCRYAHIDGTPDCLIGQALYRIDQKYGTHYMPDYECLLGARTLLTQLGADEDVIEAAQLAQFEQDRGEPWGEALDRYDKHMARRHPVYMTATTDTPIQAGAL